MPSQPRVAAAIQARLGSTRLPRKVLATVLERPMLLLMANRLRRARLVDEVVVATTVVDGDDELVKVCHAAGLRVHRGPVDDLAARLSGTAAEFDADVLVRVWGDCPLVNPALIDRAVARVLSASLDFLSVGSLTPPTFPPGLGFEVYRRTMLERIDRDADSDFEREFPVEFIKRRRAQLATDVIDCETDCSQISLTVDYPADLELVRAVFAHMAATPDFGYREVLDLHRREPALFAAAAELARNIDYRKKLESQG